MNWSAPIPLSRCALLFFAQAGPKGIPTAEAECRELLAAAHLLPEVREDASLRIAELRAGGLPVLEQAATSGGGPQARLACLSLAALADDRRARAILGRVLRDRDDADLRLLAALALSFGSGADGEALLLGGLRDPRASALERATCALSLAGSGMVTVRGPCLALLGEEGDPLVAGALAIAFGLAGDEAVIPKLEERLARCREPTERSGLLLALAALDRRQVPAPADLLSADPVLPFAAALHFVDEPSDEGAAAAFGRALGDPPLAAVLYLALGRGSEARSRMRLAEGARREVDPRVRAALYGAAAARREAPTLLALRSDPEDRASLFAAASLFLLSASGKGSSLSTGLGPAALEALADPASPAAPAAAVFAACARLEAASEPLERWVSRGGAGAGRAALARKALAGELEERALAALAGELAFERGVRIERAMADGVHRFATLAIGGGSEYVARRTERGGEVPRAWLASGRPASREATIYEDLWLLLARRPFDRPLRRGR